MATPQTVAHHVWYLPLLNMQPQIKHGSCQRHRSRPDLTHASPQTSPLWPHGSRPVHPAVSRGDVTKPPVVLIIARFWVGVASCVTDGGTTSPMAPDITRSQLRLSLPRPPLRVQAHFPAVVAWRWLEAQSCAPAARLSTRTTTPSWQWCPLLVGRHREV